MCREWIIQEYLGNNQYKDVTNRSALLTRTEMIGRLQECYEKYPDKEFRGHNVTNERTSPTNCIKDCIKDMLKPIGGLRKAG